MNESRRVYFSVSDYIWLLVVSINIIVGVSHLRSIAKSLEVIAAPPMTESHESQKGVETK